MRGVSWRIWPVLAFLWSAVVVGVVVNLFSDWLGELTYSSRWILWGSAAGILLAIASVWRIIARGESTDSDRSFPFSRRWKSYGLRMSVSVRRAWPKNIAAL